MLKPNRAIIVALVFSAVLNLILIGYTLYLFSYLQRSQHWNALGRTSVNLRVLTALESGKTNDAVELLEMQLVGDKILIENHPELTPQTAPILEGLNNYAWKVRQPTEQNEPPEE